MKTQAFKATGEAKKGTQVVVKATWFALWLFLGQALLFPVFLRPVTAIFDFGEISPTLSPCLTLFGVWIQGGVSQLHEGSEGRYGRGLHWLCRTNESSWQTFHSSDHPLGTKVEGL